MGLKHRVIAQWKEDLLETEDFPKFHIDYECVEQKNGKLVGDASLFLAYRNVHVEIDAAEGDIKSRNREIATWMKNKRSSEIIHAFTGIPLEDAVQLTEPRALWEVNYELQRVTPRQYLSVLEGYLATGVVDWARLLPKNGRVSTHSDLRRQRRPVAKPAEREPEPAE